MLRLPANDSSDPAARAAEASLDPRAPQLSAFAAFPWSLPADEVDKMARLEGGETLRFPRTVEDYLDRVVQGDSSWDCSRARLALSPKRSQAPGEDEWAAMTSEVPLCLLNCRQRVQTLALRAHGRRPSDAPAPEFSERASPTDLTIAVMQALYAARGDTSVSWTQVLARLARWETEAVAPREAQARASGGRALRQVVKDRGDSTFHFAGDGLSEDAREFSLPPRALLAALDLPLHAFLADLGPARPLDPVVFLDSVAVVAPHYWDLSLNGHPDVSPALIPDYATHVGLRGNADRCGALALALANQPGRDLQKVSIHLAGPASKEDLPQAPAGWYVDSLESTWTLRRVISLATAART
jgi:hypothetical protein